MIAPTTDGLARPQIFGQAEDTLPGDPKEPATQTRKLLLVSHTHWDREWYLTLESFRVRLVEVLDAILSESHHNREFRHFHTDSQTIIFRDYLEVKPGQKAALRAAAAEGRVCAGPFYVLNDEFLCSGEAWIENLLFGAEDCALLGVQPSKVCYVVDNFGHISQLPQISRQFGLRYFYGTRGWPFGEVKQSEFWVEGPDGSRLLAVCHPWTYGLMRSLGDTDESIRSRLQEALDKLTSLAHPEAPLLLMNGIDHAAPPRNLDQILRVIREEDPSARQVSLDEYFTALEETLPDAMEVKKLECRFAPGLYDVISSRIPQKLLYEEARLWLEDRLDPLCALKLLDGHTIPSDHRKYLWRKFLENLPHDSICGCSMDAVHRDIQQRLVGCIDGARTLFLRTLDSYLGATEDPVVASEGNHLYFLNTLPYPYSGVVEAELDFPEDEGVFHWALLDAAGAAVPFQLLSTHRIVKRLPTEDDVPTRRAMMRARIAVQTSAPPLGFARLDVVPSAGRANLFSAIYGTENYNATFNAGEAPHISPKHGVLENEHLLCELDAHGTWSVLLKATGQRTHRQNLFEYAPDLGDLYKRGQLPANPRTLSDGALRRVTLEQNGPLLATYAVEFHLRVPAGVEIDYSAMKEEEREIRICSRVTLRRGSPILEFATTIDNTASDHEIRSLFQAHSNGMQSAADGIFDVHRRTSPESSFVLRHPYLQAFQSSRAPNKEFIDLSCQTGGVAVLTAGLQEHEILPGEPDGIALTLLRATGWIYRESMGETFTPEAQCHGRMTARYALYPHAGDRLSASVKKTARQFCAPIFSRHLYGAGNTPLSRGLLALEGDASFSAIKPSHDGKSAILRFYNTEEGNGRATIALRHGSRWHAQLTSMNELEGTPLQLSGSTLNLTIGSHVITTVKLQRESTSSASP